MKVVRTSTTSPHIGKCDAARGPKYVIVKGALRQVFKMMPLGLLLLSVVDALAGQELQEFQVEGVLRFTQPSSPLPPASRRVRINSHGNQWAIRQILSTRLMTRYPTNMPIPNVEVQMLSSDGTNIYYLEHCETNSMSSASFDHPNPILNTLVGQIHQPGFPRWVCEPSMVSLFYAYLSARYLDEVTNNLLDPIHFSPMDLAIFEDQKVHAIYQRTSDSHGLPREIVFFDYDGKATNFLLAASNLTLLPGGQLPLRVEVTRYNSRNGEPLQTYDFEVSDIKHKPGASSFRPDLTPGALVRDYRFTHGMAYVQGIDHGFLTNWPTEAEAKLRPDYEGNKINWERIRIRNSTGSW